MLNIRGYYLDGQTAKRVEASLQTMNGSGLSLVVDKVPAQPLFLDYKDIRIEAPLGNTPREISLGEQRLFISEDHEGVEQLSKVTQQGEFPFSLVYKLEANLGIIGLFTLAVIAFVWAVGVHGIPHAAKTIAFDMPEYVEGNLSTSLDVLDTAFLEPSQLSNTRQAQVRLLFSEYLEAHQALKPKVHFRSGIGANALALPNGDIVFTDDLVNLVENDQELIAVLFHELGHLEHKHITRRILQDSMITLVVILLTGDIDSVDILTGIPTLIVDLAYSREFELEADRYAISMLKESAIPVDTFSIMIRRLSDHYDIDDSANKESSISDFLSTHPHTQDRIQQVEQFK